MRSWSCRSASESRAPMKGEAVPASSCTRASRSSLPEAVAPHPPAALRSPFHARLTTSACDPAVAHSPGLTAAPTLSPSGLLTATG
jgi:hypothetical protein